MPPTSLHHATARPPAATPAASPVPSANASSAADQHLRRRVLERLSQTTLRHLGIQIQVHDGLVRLCGNLRDARLRAHAEWLVFTIDGVEAVCSDWQISPSAHHAEQRH